MAMYRPKNLFNVPLVLLIPTYTTVNGVKKKTFPAVSNGMPFFGSFKTYGGTESTVNGVFSVENTAEVETWYFPEVKSDCRVALAETGDIFEIVGDPENIEMRNQFLKFKVNRVKGGA